MARVRVHWNLKKSGFVVRGIPKRVGDMEYTDALCLTNARFVVSAATREQCRQKQARWVHAWVEGDRCACDAHGHGEAVTYNPFRDDGFVIVGTTTPVTHAAHVSLRTIDGKPSTLVTA